MSFVVDHIVAVSAVLMLDGMPVTREAINSAVKRLTHMPTHDIEYPQMEEWPISAELSASKGGWFVLAGSFNYLTWQQMSPVACGLSREFDAEVWHICRDETGVARVDLWIDGHLRTTMPGELYGEEWTCSCPAADTSADTLWTDEREARSNYVPRTIELSCSTHGTRWRVVESDADRRARRRNVALYREAKKRLKRIGVEERRMRRNKERTAKRLAKAEGCKIQRRKIPPDELEPGAWRVVVTHPALGQFGGWSLADAVEKMQIAISAPRRAANVAALVKRRHGGEVDGTEAFDKAWEMAMKKLRTVPRAPSRHRAPRRRAGRGRRPSRRRTRRSDREAWC